MNRYTAGVQLSGKEKDKAVRMMEYYHWSEEDHIDRANNLYSLFKDYLKLKKKVKLLEKKLVRINAQHVEVSDVSDVTDSDVTDVSDVSDVTDSDASEEED